jgi:hypothetical protein
VASFDAFRCAFLRLFGPELLGYSCAVPPLTDRLQRKERQVTNEGEPVDRADLNSCRTELVGILALDLNQGCGVSSGREPFVDECGSVSFPLIL